jgi:hypothetical protein
MAWDPEGWDQHEDGISAISRHARVTQARARYNVVCMHEYGVRHSVEEPSVAAVTQALNRCICSFGTGYSIVLLPLCQNYSVRSCTVSRSDGRCCRSEKMVRCVMNGICRKKGSKGKKLAVDVAPACKSRPQSFGATLLFLALHNTLSFIRQMSVVSGEDGNHAQMTTGSFALRLYTHSARRHALATPNPAANRS